MQRALVDAVRIVKRLLEWTSTGIIRPLTVSIILLTLLLPLSLFIEAPSCNRSFQFSTQGLYLSSPSQTSPYITTFSISQNSSDFTPFVLYPASDRTVWVVTIKQGNIINNAIQPPQAEIVNYTISVGAKAVITLVNAIPSDIVYDQMQKRVWFLENNSLAYYNQSAPSNHMTVEQTFLSGSPQYMTTDKNGRIWITLLGTNQIVEYDPVEKKLVYSYSAPVASASLQGITTAPDGSVWFAETTAKRIGHIISCQVPPCSVIDYGPPAGVDIIFPIQLAVDRQGIVWFTDHGGSQFGSFNGSTGEWRVFGIGYCSEGYNPDCEIGLPNAIALDPNGMIWFSEHFAGRIAKYDPSTRILTEYSVPATTLPYVWWMWPGPGNLVWFTAFGLGSIGFVNASVPVPISITAGVGPVRIEQGTSQSISASITNQGDTPIYLNVTANGHDAPFGSPPLLYGSADPNRIVPTTNTATAGFKVSAAFTADLGERYVTLTAYNSNVAVNAFVNVNVTRATIPFIIRTNAPYISVGFALGTGLGTVGIFLFSLTKGLRKQHESEELMNEN